MNFMSFNALALEAFWTWVETCFIGYRTSPSLGFMVVENEDKNQSLTTLNGRHLLWGIDNRAFVHILSDILCKSQSTNAGGKTCGMSH